MKKSPSFSFGTDFHGNLKNVDHFLRESKEREVDHVIFGGDIAPKKMAIQFSDVQGYQLQGEFDPHFITDAKPLYEMGYMLFDSPFSSEEIKCLFELFEKFERMSHPKNESDRMTGLTQNEIEIFESFIVPKLVKLFEVDTYAQKTFSAFEGHYNRMKSKEPISVEKLLNDMIMKFKVDYIVKNRLINKKKERDAYLFGDPNVPDEQFKEVFDDIYYVGALNVSFVYGLAATHIAPWVEWANANRHLHKHSLPHQEKFIQDFLKRIQEFRQQFVGSVSVILGNDDHVNLKNHLDEADRSGIITHATNKVVSLSPNFQMLGYSFVPPIETVEHCDWFKSEDEMLTRLLTLLEQVREGVYCIANIHAPPNESALGCMIKDGIQHDVGSSAVRDFLLKFQPSLSLHGHLHESWRVTDNVQDNIGSTVLYNPGASEFNPRFIVGSLKNPEEFELIDSDSIGR